MKVVLNMVIKLIQPIIYILSAKVDQRPRMLVDWRNAKYNECDFFFFFFIRILKFCKPDAGVKNITDPDAIGNHEKWFWKTRKGSWDWWQPCQIGNRFEFKRFKNDHSSSEEFFSRMALRVPEIFSSANGKLRPWIFQETRIQSGRLVLVRTREWTLSQ